MDITAQTLAEKTPFKFREYKHKFRKRSTKSLISGYSRFNDEFRKIARNEFKKRKIPASKLPYKKRTTRRRESDLLSGLGGWSVFQPRRTTRRTTKRRENKGFNLFGGL